jgi:hypothetical protein
MKRIWRGVSLAIFLAGVISFAQVRGDLQVQQNPTETRPQETEVNDIEPPQSYILDSVQTRIDANGIETVTGRTTRYVKANGEWKLGPYGFRPGDQSDNKPGVYAQTSEGVYARAKDSDSLRSVSPPAPKEMTDYFRSHSYLRSVSTFVRTDEVAGIKVYVLRTSFSDPANPDEWLEDSYSPKTGFVPLRHVRHFRDGSEFRLEAIRVRFEPVPDNLNDDLKSLPVQPKENKNQ